MNDFSNQNSSTVFPLPGGVLTSKFGMRNGRQHRGIDLGIPGNPNGSEPVVAYKSGEVVVASSLNGYGNVVYINHDDGMQSRYAHLHNFSVSSGDKVTAGQELGKMGNTGIGTGPHLHFEIRKGHSTNNRDTKPIDPLSIINASEQSNSTQKELSEASEFKDDKNKEQNKEKPTADGSLSNGNIASNTNLDKNNMSENSSGPSSELKNESNLANSNNSDNTMQENKTQSEDIRQLYKDYEKATDTQDTENIDKLEKIMSEKGLKTDKQTIAYNTLDSNMSHNINSSTNNMVKELTAAEQYVQSKGQNLNHPNKLNNVSKDYTQISNTESARAYQKEIHPQPSITPIAIPGHNVPIMANTQSQPASMAQKQSRTVDHVTSTLMDRIFENTITSFMNGAIDFGLGNKATTVFKNSASA